MEERNCGFNTLLRLTHEQTFFRQALKGVKSFTCKHVNLSISKKFWPIQFDFSYKIDLVTVFDAILTSRQKREKLQCLYENLMSNNFRKTAVLKKISIVN